MEKEKLKKILVTREWVKMVALEMATRTYYDDDDRRQGKIPTTGYPGAEKALIKWLGQLGVEVKK